MGLVSRVVEEAGIPTVCISTGRDLTAKVKPPRSLFLNFPMGNTFGKSGDIDTQTQVLRMALDLVVTARQAGVMGFAAGESICYIGCHLLESSGGDWGYKSLDESVHPYYYSCPLRYLDMAPVQSSEWRERVHRFHAGRAV